MYLDSSLRSFEVIVPMLHGLNNGEGFSIKDIIVEFHNKTLRETEGNKVQVSVVGLAYNSRERKF